MEQSKVKSIKEIFSEAWDLYRERVLTILLTAILAPLLSSIFLASIGATAFFSLGGQPFFTGDLKEILMNPIIIGTGTLLFFAIIFLTSWCHAAILTVTARDDLGVGKGLIISWKYVISLLWITSLYSGIIIAGLLFLLLPSLILALSMSLCFFVMVAEDRTGIDAILASRLYIRGHWWNTLGKLLPVWITLCLLSLIPVAGPFLTLLFFPFLMLYTVSIYNNLKECAEAQEPPTGTGWLWVLFGAFGFFLPLLAFIGSIVTLGPQLPGFMQKVQTEVNETLGKDIFPQPEAAQEEPLDEGTATPPTVRQLPSVDGFLIWRDPIGDAHSHLLDVKEVSAKGEQGELILSTTLTRPLATHFLTLKKGGLDSLISFHLDTDMDQTTGGMPFGQKQGKTGYDLEIQVRIIAQQQEDGSVTGVLEAPFYEVNGQERRSLGVLNKKNITVSGNTVTIRLPYRQVKLEPGNTVRICYRETAQEQGRGVAKDKLIPLN